MGKKSPKKGRRAGGRSEKKPRKEAQTKGFEFGCLPFAMAVSSFEFPKQLSDASVVGVAYGSAPSKAVAAMLPNISLVVENPEPLAEAFRTFHAWADSTDPDALELTIVFFDRGGYVLALGPEIERLTRRCLGYDRSHRPLVSIATWFKQIDSVNPALRQLADYADNSIAPFLLDGLTLIPSSGAPQLSDARPISGLDPLLKFEITFVEEADVEPNTLAALALRMSEGAAETVPGVAPPPDETPEGIAARRVNVLRTHFPVTLGRLRDTSEGQLYKDLRPPGAELWQVEQAVCNLTLSYSATKEAHYRGLPSGDFEGDLVRLLRDHYEFADGGPILSSSEDELTAQILADTNALLTHLGQPRAPGLPAAVEALRAASALEASPAIPGLAEAWSVVP